MSPPPDRDKALRAAVIAALAASASNEASGQMPGAAAQSRPGSAISRQDVYLDREGVVLNIPGLAQQVQQRPEEALARLRQTDPNVKLSDISVNKRGFVVVHGSTFRRGIKSIGDTNPSCNVNCYAGCT